jgi:hypothetical protein
MYVTLRVMQTNHHNEFAEDKPITAEALVSVSQSVITDRTIFTGGHFVLEAGEPTLLNEGTLLSFEAAVRSFAILKTKYKELGFGILINDIGAICTTTCTINNHGFDRDCFAIPFFYKQILEKYKVTVSELIIFWEKKMRNRSQKELMRRVGKDPNIEIQDGQTWLTKINKEKILLSRKSVHCPYGTPACPLIMAGYVMEQSRKNFYQSINYYYVDTDNFENIPNHFMIEKGSEVGGYFLSQNHNESKFKSLNIYFTRTQIFTNF